MAEPQVSPPILPGLEGYHLVELQLEQRVLASELLPPGTNFGVYGSVDLDVPTPVKLLLELDGLTGSMGLAFTDLRQEDIEMGELGPTVLWLTLRTPGIPPHKAGFFLRTSLPAQFARVFRVSEETTSLPWPPKPASRVRTKEEVAFRQLLEAGDAGGWKVRLVVNVGEIDKPIELLVMCDCPSDQIQIFMSENAPSYDARCTGGPGDQPNSLTIFADPSAITRDGLLLLVLKSEKMLRVESVRRVC